MLLSRWLASRRDTKPTQSRGSAALSAKDAQKKAYLERKAKEKGAKTKSASELLAKKPKAKVDPKYKPQKATGYTRAERRRIIQQGRKLARDIVKGKEKPASAYNPRLDQASKDAYSKK